MSFMFLTGRHVTAAEALQLGIVDQVTDHKTVDVAVKLALSVAGETLKHKVPTSIKSSHGFKKLTPRMEQLFLPEQ